MSSVLEDIARSYDQDAQWHDTESAVRKRLEHYGSSEKSWAS